MERLIRRSSLADLYEKASSGERLSFQDGVRLYREPDLTAVGYLANLVRERKHGDITYYVRNQHINYTNVCNKFCRFCSFYALPGDPRAYTLSPEEVGEKVRAYLHLPIREIHMVGGVNPKLPYRYYLDLIRIIKEVRPDVHLKAFTMVELYQIAKVAKRPLSEVLLELKAAGLDSLPGGGAEVFSERVHQELFPLKIGAEGWLEIAKTAHQVGLRSNATMLYGHIETPEEKVEHLIRLRALQDETKGFLAYVPLAFDPQHTALDHLPKTTGEADLREIAVARLMLDNFDHIKAFWIMITPEVAQASLWYGANDMDGTVLEYEITHALGTPSNHQALTRQKLVAMITEAGRVPVERDALYRRVDAEGRQGIGADG